MSKNWIRISFLLLTGSAFAQSLAPLAFEVASVKPSAPIDMAAMRAGKAHVGTKIDAARVDIGAASLFRLICIAYRLKPYRVAGPEWLKTTMFDVLAKIPDGSSASQVPEMLQTLLAERFGLKVHVESRDESVYALVVARGGPKLKESLLEAAQADPANAHEKAKGESMSVPTLQGDVKMTRVGQGLSIEMPGGEISGKVRVTMIGGTGSVPPKFHLESSGTSMKTFAEMLSVGVVERPVVDMTGLSGNYDVAVDMSAEDAMNVTRASVSFGMGGGGGGRGGGGDAGRGPAALASDPPGASIFASIQNLGLRLEARKLPLEMLVIDHVEKTPTRIKRRLG